MSRVATLALLVDDYDRAIDWFTRCLRFDLIENVPMDDKRWVVMAPQGAGAHILLARASTPDQVAAIGNQAGGRVWLLLETEDFAAEHAHMLAAGVVFEEAPRAEPYGIVAVFNDLYGNRWDLLQKHPSRPKAG